MGIFRKEEISAKGSVIVFIFVWVVTAGSTVFILPLYISNPDAEFAAITVPAVASVTIFYHGIRYKMSSLTFLKIGRKVSYIMGSVGLALVAIAGIYPGITENEIKNPQFFHADFMMVAMCFGAIALSGFIVDPKITLLENQK